MTIKHFSNILRMNQWVLNMICLNNILNFEVPTALAKTLYEIKDKKKNNDLVELIKIRWSNLKDEIEKMSEDEKKN